MIHPLYHRDPLNCFFASHSDALISENVKYWICGHSHMVNSQKQCISNPIGYEEERTILTLMCKEIIE